MNPSCFQNSKGQVVLSSKRSASVVSCEVCSLTVREHTCMQLFRSEKEDAGLRINTGYYTRTKKELQRTPLSVVTVLTGRLLEPGLVVHVGKQKIRTEIWWRKRQLGKLHRWRKIACWDDVGTDTEVRWFFRSVTRLGTWNFKWYSFEIPPMYVQYNVASTWQCKTTQVWRLGKPWQNLVGQCYPQRPAPT
jgi:hypothetical protein